MPARNSQELILLVGGNPLPNYIAACALREKLGIEQIHLFYTGQIKDVNDNLRNYLEGGQRHGHICELASI